VKVQNYNNNKQTKQNETKPSGHVHALKNEYSS